MIKQFLKFFRRIAVLSTEPNQASQPTPANQSTPLAQITLEAGMTRQQFTACVANCFVGVKCPEPDSAEVNIFNRLDPNLARLAWGERPQAIGFIGRYGKREWGIALVQLPYATYHFLERAYDSIGGDRFDSFVGTHTLDMTPIKTWFPVCS